MLQSLFRGMISQGHGLKVSVDAIGCSICMLICTYFEREEVYIQVIESLSDKVYISELQSLFRGKVCQGHGFWSIMRHLEVLY